MFHAAFVGSTRRNLHRRFTIPKHRAHILTPAGRLTHRCGAELIHYRLPSPRVKGTARMRLFVGFLVVYVYALRKRSDADSTSRWSTAASITPWAVEYGPLQPLTTNPFYAICRACGQRHEAVKKRLLRADTAILCHAFLFLQPKKPEIPKGSSSQPRSRHGRPILRHRCQ